MKNLYFIDYETYYDKDYTLRKMTPPEYVLGRKFSVHGAAVLGPVKAKTNSGGEWYTHEELQGLFASLHPEDTVIATFNSLFDACITAWVYDFVPALNIDVLGMARFMLGHKLTSLSLANLARYYNLPPKGDAVCFSMGLTTEQMYADKNFLDYFKQYAINDNYLCLLLYRRLLADGFPISELPIMDLVLKAAVKPQMVFDRKRLIDLRKKLKIAKRNLLDNSGVTKQQLGSTTMFAKLLEERGVIVETKLSPNTGEFIPALAKTDAFMQGLLEHDLPEVQALAAARLSVKSTGEETRAKRFCRIARLPRGKAAGTFFKGAVPVALRYAAAHTHRLGGEWKLNFQNLPRGSELRYSMCAPEGHALLVADFSQIEARLVAYLAGCSKLLKLFEEGVDVYSHFATEIFGYPVTGKTHPVERFIGKTAILGLGYGCGPHKFQNMVHSSSRIQLGKVVEFPLERAQSVVAMYRKVVYPQIPFVWRKFEKIINKLYENPQPVWKTQFPMLDFAPNQIILPGGRRLTYSNLTPVQKEDEIMVFKNTMTYTYGKETRHIYGGKVTENVCQALGGILAMEAALRIKYASQRELDHPLEMCLQAHDELGFVVPERLAQEAASLIEREMVARPDWAPHLPLAISMSKPVKSYGEAK